MSGGASLLLTKGSSPRSPGRGLLEERRFPKKMSSQHLTWHDQQQLEIRYTGNLRGNLERLPYLATLIKKERQAHPQLLMCDTGSFCGPLELGPVRGEAQVKVYNYLQYDALTPSREDLLDTQQYKRLARLANFPFLATNWRGLGEGDYYERRLIKERQDEKALILGMAHPAPFPDNELLSYKEALEWAVEGFDPASTVVVILSQLDANQNLALAKEGPFTKIILSGQSTPGLEESMRLGNSLLAPAVPGPQSLGSLQVKLSGALEIH